MSLRGSSTYATGLPAVRGCEHTPRRAQGVKTPPGRGGGAAVRCDLPAVKCFKQKEPAVTRLRPDWTPVADADHDIWCQRRRRRVLVCPCGATEVQTCDSCGAHTDAAVAPGSFCDHAIDFQARRNPASASTGWTYRR